MERERQEQPDGHAFQSNALFPCLSQACKVDIFAAKVRKFSFMPFEAEPIENK